MFVLILNQRIVFILGMKKYIEIDVEELIKMRDSGQSMREIERNTDYSFTKIQKEIKSYNFNKVVKELYKEIEGKTLIATCIKTGKIFIDIKNSSGTITEHIINTYPEFKIETNFKRKDYEYKNLKYWYHDFFEFTNIDQLNQETKKCPYCDWETTDILNKSGAFMNHVNTCHSINFKDHLELYPDDQIFFKADIIKENRKKNLEKINNHVTCRICGEKFKQINLKHLETHNTTIQEYRKNFNLDDIGDTVSKTTRKIYVKNRATVFKPKKFNKRSKAEKEICEILTLNNIDYIKNDRIILDGFEVDICIPDKKLVIEYNGVYYHSEKNGKKHPRYHIDKLQLANEKGYSMIQIFEDEWLFNKEMVINKILHILGVNNKEKIYARKCEIREINNSFEKNCFLNINHIQGEDKSNYHYGAYYKNNLVAVMTFDNNRQLSKEKLHNEDLYELKRFATNINYSVIGIGSKLFKFFLKDKNPKRVISFADLRWTINIKDNLYNKIGFKLDKILRHDYYYIKFSGIYKNKRLHKFGFGKKRLKQLYPEIYDDNKTEWEIMQEAGFDRIWDCGKLKYVYDSTSI